MELLILLGLFFALSFSLFFLIFIPFKFTVTSLITLLHAPRQIVRVASNHQLRRNHALEHATINILESELGCSNLSGWATEEGFYVKGKVNPAKVLKAAKKGLWLLEQGKDDLVVHKSCGTSIIVANLSAAIIFLSLVFLTTSFSIFNVLLAILLANLLGPFLGSWVQKRFTTSVDVTGMEIVDGYYRKYPDFLFSLQSNNEIFVKTEKLRVY